MLKEEAYWGLGIAITAFVMNLRDIAYAEADAEKRREDEPKRWR